jgi:pimeloyl-ACP methyl ester carboxylesterase
MTNLLSTIKQKPMLLLQRILTAFLLIFVSISTQAQSVVGVWYGDLNVQGQVIGIILNISDDSGTLSATIDIPMQGAKGLAADHVSFSDSSLAVKLSAFGIEYKGLLATNDLIKGNFMQAGLVLPLDFGKEIKEAPSKPQDPKKPYPYIEEHVTFQNSTDATKLAGTLTLPSKEGQYPAVILVSGSGPQNRDSEIMGHKPFLILADYFTKAGYAVLRYDDRGVANSQGVFSLSTMEDFASDAAAAFLFLKTHPNILADKIGIAGHSEGGAIAAIVAAEHKDLAFIISMAGPALPGDSILLLQKRLIESAAGVPEPTIDDGVNINRKMFNIIKKNLEGDALHQALETEYRQYLGQVGSPEGISVDREKQIKEFVATLTTPWLMGFVRYNPEYKLNQVRCPILAINGSKDLQVPSKENLAAIKKITHDSGNMRVTIQELAGLNHLFQECNTGAISEYATIQQTFSPTAMQLMVEWLQQIIK